MNVHQCCDTRFVTQRVDYERRYTLGAGIRPMRPKAKAYSPEAVVKISFGNKRGKRVDMGQTCNAAFDISHACVPTKSVCKQYPPRNNRSRENLE